MGKTDWRESGQLHATDSTGRRFVIKVHSQWHEVSTIMDSGPRWEDSQFKRYRLADGSSLNRQDDGSFVIVATGAVLRAT